MHLIFIRTVVPAEDLDIHVITGLLLIQINDGKDLRFELNQYGYLYYQDTSHALILAYN